MKNSELKPGELYTMENNGDNIAFYKQKDDLFSMRWCEADNKIIVFLKMEPGKLEGEYVFYYLIGDQTYCNFVSDAGLEENWFKEYNEKL